MNDIETNHLKRRKLRPVSGDIVSAETFCAMLT